ILFYDVEYTKDVEPSLINLAQLYEVVGDYKKASVYYNRHYRDFKSPESLLYAILCEIVDYDYRFLDYEIKGDYNMNFILMTIIQSIKSGNIDLLNNVINILKGRPVLYEIIKSIKKKHAI